MNMVSVFYFRPSNSNGTFDSICLNCDQKDASVLTESDLAKREVQRECSTRIREDRGVDRYSWG
jgi:hypothetical protein